MQIIVHELKDFLSLRIKKNAVLLDVRSSAEHLKAHIPGALSLPLMDNEHRVIIGTIYKQEGREAAVLKGFELIGPLFHEKISKASELAPDKEVFLYCWRGGMRSNIMAWVLQMAGFKVHLLKGGYKSFRHWTLAQLELPFNTIVLGGKTGSGKTEMLYLLKEEGEQIIDLEDLANHRGSAYGHLGKPDQPSQEQFENLIGWELANLNLTERIWLENESRAIGKVNLPNVIFNQIRNSVQVEMNTVDSVRQDRILKEYGVFSIEELKERTERIGKRLGGQHLKAAIEFLDRADMYGWLSIVLYYYDKTYSHGNYERVEGSIETVVITWNEPEVEVRKLINAANKVSTK